jgi:hypothetical protein
MTIQRQCNNQPLQWHNLHLVYIIINFIVMLHALVSFSLWATYLTNIKRNINCAFNNHHSILADFCVSIVVYSSTIHDRNSSDSLLVRSSGWLLCLWCYPAVGCPQSIQIPLHFSSVLMLCFVFAPPLPSDWLLCWHAAPIRLRVDIDCCVVKRAAATVCRHAMEDYGQSNWHQGLIWAREIMSFLEHISLARYCQIKPSASRGLKMLA